MCNLIFGVYAPSAGQMQFGGKAWLPPSPAEALEQGIAMVHQHFSLVPRMTVVENLMLGQARGVLNRAAFAARISDIADRFGFALDPNAVVGELSVGERQRAEIVKGLLLIAISGKSVPDAIEAFLDGAFGTAFAFGASINRACLLYTSPSPRD